MIKWWKGSQEDLHTFHDIDTVEDVDNSTIFPTEFLHSLNQFGLPEHTLNSGNLAKECGHFCWPLQQNTIFGQND